MHETPNYYNTPQDHLVIDRRRPGRGFVHLLRKRDITQFINLIPDWDELSQGLDAIVLSEGSRHHYGWHVPGVVHICAWPRTLWELTDPDFVDENEDFLQALGCRYKKCGNQVRIHWTRRQARAFQLLDVLLHELGHHHDRMNTQSQFDSARGEPYAEDFARERRHELLERCDRALKLL